MELAISKNIKSPTQTPGFKTQDLENAHRIDNTRKMTTIQVEARRSKNNMRQSGAMKLSQKPSLSPEGRPDKNAFMPFSNL